VLLHLFLFSCFEAGGTFCWSHYFPKDCRRSRIKVYNRSLNNSECLSKWFIISSWY
jgi:hypothetical protein